MVCRTSFRRGVISLLFARSGCSVVIAVEVRVVSIDGRVRTVPIPCTCSCTTQSIFPLCNDLPVTCLSCCNPSRCVVVDVEAVSVVVLSQVKLRQVPSRSALQGLGKLSSSGCGQISPQEGIERRQFYERLLVTAWILVHDHTT